MDDDRIWAFEDRLWRADAQHYHDAIDAECLMVIAAPPYIMTGMEAADVVSKTPRWSTVEFSEQRVSRPQTGLIVIAYRVLAAKEEASPYDARCTSVYHKTDADTWTVVQHQQSPVLAD